METRRRGSGTSERRPHKRGVLVGLLQSFLRVTQSPKPRFRISLSGGKARMWKSLPMAWAGLVCGKLILPVAGCHAASSLLSIPPPPTVGVLGLQANPPQTDLLPPPPQPSPGARREGGARVTAEKVGAHTPKTTKNWLKAAQGRRWGREADWRGRRRAASGRATRPDPRSFLPCPLRARWAPSTVPVAREAQGEAAGQLLL